MAKSSNFFLQPRVNSTTSIDSTTAKLIHPILHDVHTLRKLADAQRIDLNVTSRKRHFPSFTQHHIAFLIEQPLPPKKRPIVKG
ncbi:hypothetical protein FPOAC1_007098 [Fusarium poae]|uniref:hypothetical protein n=1 Tax=Fusarium poae TaxID=36050 RepID=UPI001CE754B4|nr:hypothetical protein FPOAC1_007098 [Fusarium poae]KAG8673779.1 hypothetical protein FPOAC1_007098 [Fusarium poae]